jgi:hypothetical protein
MGVLGNHDQYMPLPYTPREGAAPGLPALVGRQFFHFREGGLKLTFVNAASFREFAVADRASAQRRHKSDRKG